MNNINVTIELCAEDRARLDNILEALRGAAVVPCVEAEKVANTEKAAKVAPAPAEAAPVETVTPEPAKEEPKQAETVPEVTAAELQSKVVQLVGAGKKNEARAIVTEYAKSVSEIPAEKRAEVLKRLNALEG